MKSRNQSGSAHVIIVVVLVVALLGALGFVFWQNFVNKAEPANETTQTSSSTEQKGDAVCNSGEDEQATSGVFCSDTYGIKFKVSDIFKGHLKKADNEPIYPVADTKPESIGTTQSVISATVTQGQYDYVLTISLLPQIDTMSLGLIAAGQFDSSDKKVYSIVSSAENPTFHRGGEYTYVTSKSGIKVYRDTYGDVGYMLYKSAVIVGGKVVVIDLRDNPNSDLGLPTENPVIDDTDILATIELLK